MTTQQWRLKKIPEPRTLADVPSSREKPVLCWVNNGCELCPLWFDGTYVKRIIATGEWLPFSKLLSPSDFTLYHQPSRPTKLEDVPDRRVIYSKETLTFIPSLLWFKDSGKYFMRCEHKGGEFKPASEGPPKDWQLTDCIVELETVEVGELT